MNKIIFFINLFSTLFSLHLCTFKTPIINSFSLVFYEFYSLEHIYLSYYKHLPKCSYNISKENKLNILLKYYLKKDAIVRIM